MGRWGTIIAGALVLAAALAPHYRHVRSLPVMNFSPHWRHLSWFAFRNHLDTATVALGRVDPRVEARERARGEEVLRTGAYDEEAIYVLAPAEAQATIPHLRPDDAFGRADGIIIFARGGKSILDAAGIKLEPFAVPGR